MFYHLGLPWGLLFEVKGRVASPVAWLFRRLPFIHFRTPPRTLKTNPKHCNLIYSVLCFFFCMENLFLATCWNCINTGVFAWFCPKNTANTIILAPKVETPRKYRGFWPARRQKQRERRKTAVFTVFFCPEGFHILAKHSETPPIWRFLGPCAHHLHHQQQ